MRIAGLLIHVGLRCVDSVFGAYHRLVLVKRRFYRPERHYMRGGGPKSKVKKTGMGAQSHA